MLAMNDVTYGAYAALTEASHSGRFGDALFQIAHAHGGVDEIFAYCLEGAEGPVALASSGRRETSQRRASLYLDRFHALDPLNEMISRDTAKQTYTVRASDIADRQYRLECYERPAFDEKISFVDRCGTRTLVLSFYRARTGPPLDMEGIAALSKLAMPMLRTRLGSPTRAQEQPLLERLAARMAVFYPQMTEREVQVCSRSVVGMTAEAIGLELGIRTSSVLTYRRRAYDRLGVSTVNQLLGPLIG